MYVVIGVFLLAPGMSSSSCSVETLTVIQTTLYYSISDSYGRIHPLYYSGDATAR